MDSTLEEVYREVAERHGVSINKVKEMHDFHNVKIKEVVKELGKNFISIHIPTFGYLEMMQIKYRKHEERNKLIQENKEHKED